MAETPGGVGATALGTARGRALESLRADRLFDDPLAAAFVHAAGRPLEGDAADSSGMQAWLAVRTRFLDDLVLSARCPQVVLLGAGLDTRAYRLPWPSNTCAWELDTESVLAFKESVLTREGALPACERVPVVADLAGDWGASLVDAGFDRAVPSVWVIEGVFVYLTDEQNQRMVETASGLAARGSRLGATMRTPTAPPPRAGGRMGAVVAMWQSDGVSDPAGWLGRHGWDVQVTGMTEQSAAYGRPIGDRPSTAVLVSGARR